MRSWIWDTSSLEGTVMTAKVRSHSPVFGSLQFSIAPLGRRVSRLSWLLRRAACMPLMARHSKKPSTGTMQRRRALAS